MKKREVGIRFWCLLLVLVVLSTLSRADSIRLVYLPGDGSFSISQSSGIRESAYVWGLDGRYGRRGQWRGVITLSTGPMLSGSLLSSAVFSSQGSTFDVYGGLGNSLFTGGLTGDVYWTALGVHRRAGKAEEEFELRGEVEGELWNGVEVTGEARQQVWLLRNGEWRGGKGWMSAGGGGKGGGGGLGTAPEPSTLWLLGSGGLATGLRLVLLKVRQIRQ